MTGLKTQNRRTAAGDPLSDLLDDTSMKRSAARARPRVTYPTTSSPTNAWWVAGGASLIWIAAVFAFAWGRFALPGDPRSVIDAAQSRIGFSDMLMILAAIAGPVLLIWVIAWLVRRSMELRDESRRLAKAAILLADAAETAEKRAELMLPAPDTPGGELIAQGPGHLHREIERASHAMNALQSQMSSMEEALSRQAAAFDNAAESAAARTMAFQTSAGVAGAGLVGVATGPSRPSGNLILGDDDSDIVVTDGDTGDAIAVDLAFESAPVTEADRLRAGLATAASGNAWAKLVPNNQETSTKTPATPLETMRDDLAEMKESSTAKVSDALDPFDDLGPSAPKAAAGAALGAGVAMGFGATRDEDAASPSAGARLDTAMLTESEPVPLAQPKADPAAKGEEFEFMPRALDWKKFVRAANFPENEADTATLDALYDVLTDPEAAALLQSSEDVLATLADLDLYMEDFVPEMSPVLAWRGHLEGKKGVTGIDMPIEQSRISAKLGSDAKFNKLSERFVERYQIILSRLFEEAVDDRLALEMADSRTGRAYILVAGALGKL